MYTGGIRFILGANVGGNPSGSRARATHKPSLNEWHHIAGVVDGEQMRLYVDGVLRATNTPDSITHPRSTNTAVATMGPRYENHSSRVRGNVSNLQIFDHALSLKEVINLSEGLLYRLTFNEPETGDRVIDSSGYDLKTTLGSNKPT